MPFLSSLPRCWKDRVEDAKRGPRFDLSIVSSVVERRNTNGEKPALRALVPNFFFLLDVIPYLRFAAIFPHITPMSNNAAIECEFIPYTILISRSNIAIKHVSLQMYVTHFLVNHAQASPSTFPIPSRLFFPVNIRETVKQKKEEKKLICRTNFVHSLILCFSSLDYTINMLRGRYWAKVWICVRLILRDVYRLFLLFHYLD